MSAVAITVDNTLGALLVGFAASCCLLGIIAAQVSSYFSRYHADKPTYKALVVVILFCELADQLLIGHVVYYYIISNFSDILAILRGSVTWSFILQQTLGGIVGSVVTICYSLRVWRFSGKNWAITGILIALSLAHFGSAIAFTVQAFQLPTVASVSDLKGIGTAALALGAATDILTALALCYFLGKLRTGQKQSDSLVSSLMIYAVSTGAVTSLVSISCLVLFNTMPSNLIFIAVYFVLTNAALMQATLNTRRSVRGKGTDQQNISTENTTSFRLSSRAQRTPYLQDNFGQIQLPAAEVWVTQSQESREDGYSLAKFNHSRPQKF